MKTIFIDGYFFNYERLGGISRMWFELIRNIVSRSDELRIILNLRDKTQNKFAEKIGHCNLKHKESLTIINEGLPANRYLRKLRDFGITRAWLNRSLINKSKLDVDIFHSSYMSTIFPKIGTIPAVVTVHDLILQKFKSLYCSWRERPNYYMQLMSENFAIRNADYLVAVSQSTKNDLIEYYGFKEERIKVIHHGISEFWFENGIEAKHGVNPYILFVGGRNLYKNYDTLLRAIALIKEKNDDLGLITVGENNHCFEAEKKRCLELGISARVTDLGIVPDNKLRQLYSEAVAVILPSIYEGFGFPLLEGFACGCPVIASDIPTNRELGQSYVHFFPTMDAGTLAEQILNVYNNPPVMETREAYRNYARQYNWQSAADNLINIYLSIV